MTSESKLLARDFLRRYWGNWNLPAVGLLVFCAALLVRWPDDFFHLPYSILLVFTCVVVFHQNESSLPPLETVRILPASRSDLGRAIWLALAGVPALASSLMNLAGVSLALLFGFQAPSLLMAALLVLMPWFGCGWKLPLPWPDLPASAPSWWNRANAALRWLLFALLWMPLVVCLILTAFHQSARFALLGRPLAEYLAGFGLLGIASAVHAWRKPEILVWEKWPASETSAPRAQKPGARWLLGWWTALRNFQAKINRRKPRFTGWKLLVWMQFEALNPFTNDGLWCVLLLSFFILRGNQSFLWILLPGSVLFIGPGFLLRLQDSARVLRSLPVAAGVMSVRLVLAATAPVLATGLVCWALVSGPEVRPVVLRSALLLTGLAAFAPAVCFRRVIKHPLPVLLALLIALGFLIRLAAWGETNQALLTALFLVIIAHAWAGFELRDGHAAYQSRPIRNFDTGELIQTWSAPTE